MNVWVGEVERKLSPRPFFWEHQGHRAVRDGKPELVAAHRGEWELCDLARDRTEQKDLAAERPETVEHFGKVL